MTDEEVEVMMPAVDEFITAVANRDRDHIAACLMVHEPSALAVLTAVVGLEQVERLREEITFLAALARRQGDELTRLRDGNKELRRMVAEQGARLHDRKVA